MGGACPLMLSGGPHTVSEFERVGTAAAAIALMALFGIAAFPGVVADIGTLPPAAWWTVHSTTVFGVAEGLSGAPPGAISTIPVGTKFPMGTVVDNPQIAITGLRGSTQPYHAVERILERGVTPTQIVNAVRNPTVALSQDGGSRFVFVTPDAAVVMRADGQIVTVWGAAQHDARYLQLLLEAGVGH